MFDVMEMPMDWPAEVNYHEAKAFCAWKGSDYRLPTEAEHHVMRGPQVSQCLAQMIEFKLCLQMGPDYYNVEDGCACQLFSFIILIPKRYHLKWNKLDYKSLCRKGT